MLVITCDGTPYEIGRKHGNEAKDHIKRCIAFYAGMFEQTSRLTWDEVGEIAKSFGTAIRQRWPEFYEEMEGVADGASRSITDILALNVRTEIAFGRFSDGCTSLAWHTSNNAFLAQNWDWKEAQKENLVVLKIRKAGKPSIQMVTEAGLIGKIGLNSEGVGVCLNAIKAKGVDAERLPVHLALRMALESPSAEQAVQQLQEFGVASSAHILVADATVAFGLEVSATSVQKIDADGMGRLTHANHFKLQHPGVVDARLLEDSECREERLLEITNGLRELSREVIFDAFRDDAGAPSAICRQQTGLSELATLFNIIMNLRNRTADVSLGRPSDVEERIQFVF